MEEVATAVVANMEAAGVMEAERVRVVEPVAHLPARLAVPTAVEAMALGTKVVDWGAVILEEREAAVVAVAAVFAVVFAVAAALLVAAVSPAAEVEAVVAAAAASMVARVARGKIHKRGICSVGSFLPGCLGTSRGMLRMRSRSDIRSSMRLVVASAAAGVEAVVDYAALVWSVAGLAAAEAAVVAPAAATMVARVARGKRSTPDICSAGS